MRTGTLPAGRQRHRYQGIPHHLRRARRGARGDRLRPEVRALPPEWCGDRVPTRSMRFPLCGSGALQSPLESFTEISELCPLLQGNCMPEPITSTDSIYDTIVCPAGTFRKSRELVMAGCAAVGYNCPPGAVCICQPCEQVPPSLVKVLVVPSVRRRKPPFLFHHSLHSVARAAQHALACCCVRDASGRQVFELWLCAVFLRHPRTLRHSRRAPSRSRSAENSRFGSPQEEVESLAPHAFCALDARC